MSLQIETVDELKGLLKASGQKVGSLEELKALVAEINANYNPDAARIRVAKLVGTIVPGTALGAAAAISFFVVAEGRRMADWQVIAALGILWGVAGIVSLIAAGLSLAFLWRRPSAMPAGKVAFNDSAVNAFRLDRSHHVTGLDGQ
jgi:hypothetical protein